jgi:hypothetical protein
MAGDQQFYRDNVGYANQKYAAAEQSATPLGSEPVPALVLVAQAFEEVHRLTARVRELADRLLGSVGEKGVGSAGVPVQSAILPALSDAAISASNALSAAQSNLDHIERAIGR